MNSIVIQHYVCRIQNGRVNPIQLDEECVKSFRSPATRKGRQKLYIVKNGKDFCYVGTTSMPMAQRMRVGFNPRTKTGYHGYPWRCLLKQVDLYVCGAELNTNKDDAETIEAELVFLIRKETGNWPIHQTEIHFHKPNDTHKRTAENLFERLR